jgi:hypothetical protein
MEINTTNISLNRYIELLEIEKNFNKKFKVVYSYNGCGLTKEIEFCSDNKTFENEIIESQNQTIESQNEKLNKLELDILQLKLNNEDLKYKLQILEMQSISDKNLIERIFNL